MKVPFTWSKLHNLAGDPIGQGERRRITAAIAAPTQETWERARTIIVGTRPSGGPATVWQCTEAATVTRWPDGQVPLAEHIVMGLCYATAEAYPGWGKR